MLCKICGKEFEPKHKNERYCSLECRKKGDFLHQKKWIKAHPEKYREIHRKVYERQRSTEEGRKYQRQLGRKSYWKHREKRIKASSEYSIKAEKKAREELIRLLGSKCQRCGTEDSRVFSVHHLGKKEEPRWVWWRRRLREFKANRNKLVLLCENCHRIVHWELRQ